MKSKIVFIAPEVFPVPPVRGGAVEHWIFEVARRLKNDDAYCLSIYDPLLENCHQRDGVHILLYRQNLLAKILLCTYKLPFKNDSSILYYLPYSFWCALQAKRLKADIIHLHNQVPFIPVIRWLNPDAKFIFHVHNLSAVKPTRGSWKRSIFDKIDVILTCSNSLRQGILRLYPYLEGKIKVIYNGVDTNLFNITAEDKAKRRTYNINNDDIVLLFAGRLVEYKGVHLLIEAFNNLAEKYPNLKLFVGGSVTYSSNLETDYTKGLKSLAAKFKDRIFFTGHIDHAVMPDFISLADIFVVPSLIEEPFGVIIIEAMAMGKPVIAFKKGGIIEIIKHNETGLITQLPDAVSLCQSLERLIVAPDERKRLGQNARRSVEEKFSWPRIVMEMTPIYQNVI